MPARLVPAAQRAVDAEDDNADANQLEAAFRAVDAMSPEELRELAKQ